MEAEQIVQAHREAERRKTDAEGVRQAHLDQVRFQLSLGIELHKYRGLSNAVPGLSRVVPGLVACSTGLVA
eukprot:g12437.t1